MALVYPAVLPRRIREYVSPAIRPCIRNPQPRRQNWPHGDALFDWHRLIERYFKAGGNEAAHAGRSALGDSRNRIAARNQIRSDRDLVFDSLNLLGAEHKARELSATRNRRLSICAPPRHVNQFDAQLTARNRAATLPPP